MGFYEQISKYYDYIFPVGQGQLKFIKESAGAAPKKILDVACGSGGYSVELARQGHELTAADLDDEMVKKAEEKARMEGQNINVMKCDMRELEHCINDRFDIVFCIGNSIVHLGSLKEISGALTQMYNLLQDDGALILQIINYDRVIKYNVNELPAIRNDEVGLEFIRKYEYVKHKGLINFNTALTINNESSKEKYENSIELLPLVSSDMMKLLMETGFREIEFFGDFNQSPYDENSYMLVVRASKKDLPSRCD